MSIAAGSGPAPVEWAIPFALAANLILVGLVAGILLGTQLGQVRVQKRLEARDFTLVKREFELALGRVMPILVIAAGVSTMPVVALLAWAGPVRFAAALTALVLWIGVIVVTLRFNAPVNARAVGWDPESPPPDWETLRDRWHRGQTIRTPLAVAAFAAVAIAAVVPGTAT